MSENKEQQFYKLKRRKDRRGWAQIYNVDQELILLVRVGRDDIWWQYAPFSSRYDCGYDKAQVFSDIFRDVVETRR